MARLIQPAALALDKAMVEIAARGGTIFLSDCFRSAAMQNKAHHDYVTGRKHDYSPPAGGSMHEAARAIDLDVGHTGIGLAAVKKILKNHGWIGIAATGTECWHHDWRGADGQAAYAKGGYKAMAKFCIAQILKKAPAPTPPIHLSEDQVRKLQTALNALGKSKLAVDGDYGPKTQAAVKVFQMAQGLSADGIVGPITLKKLEVLGWKI